MSVMDGDYEEGMQLLENMELSRVEVQVAKRTGISVDDRFADMFDADISALSDISEPSCSKFSKIQKYTT